MEQRQMRIFTNGLLPSFFSIGLLAYFLTSNSVWYPSAWIVTLVTMGLLFWWIGFILQKTPLGIFVAPTKRVSLSRFQLILWSWLILSAILVATMINLHQLQDPKKSALDFAIPNEVWALLGISLTSQAGAELIKSTKVAVLSTLDVGQGETPSLADLVRGDEAANADVVDITRVQNLFFTLILVVVYATDLGRLFHGTTGKGVIAAFPALSQSMVTLLGISHVGYLAAKATPKTSPVSVPASPLVGGKTPGELQAVRVLLPHNTPTLDDISLRVRPVSSESFNGVEQLQLINNGR